MRKIDSPDNRFIRVFISSTLRDMMKDLKA